VIDLRQRSTAPELMDAGDADAATIEACLRDLERINRWTGAYRITLRWLDQLLGARRPGRRLVLVDVGSGYGDMLRRISGWAERRGIDLELIGVDLNPHAALAAARATPPGLPVRYLTADIFDLPQTTRPDIVISALFAHHLDDARLVRFLAWMEERARLGWLINDLHRHAVSHWVARRMPVLLRMNRLVREDASLSVARFFVRRDWQRLLEAAGMSGRPTTITWRFPFRYAIGRIKPA
jgi:SAM-dependent methyltransferase